MLLVLTVNSKTVPIEYFGLAVLFNFYLFYSFHTFTGWWFAKWFLILLVFLHVYFTTVQECMYMVFCLSVTFSPLSLLNTKMLPHIQFKSGWGNCYNLKCLFLSPTYPHFVLHYTYSMPAIIYCNSCKGQSAHMGWWSFYFLLLFHCSWTKTAFCRNWKK